MYPSFAHNFKSDWIGMELLVELSRDKYAHRCTLILYFGDVKGVYKNHRFMFLLWSSFRHFEFSMTSLIGLKILKHYLNAVKALLKGHERPKLYIMQLEKYFCFIYTSKGQTGGLCVIYRADFRILHVNKLGFWQVLLP